MEQINAIKGIPLHYARLTSHPYGTRGEQRDFLIDSEFLEVLKTALAEVFAHCPLGTPEVITTAGIFVDKPGQHGNGKAFDLDAIFWSTNALVTLNFVHQKELYLGIESFLRKHFGIVLNYYYTNHEDHWHVDTSVNVDYHESSKSETLYLQMVLKFIYGKAIIVDGISGPQTRAITRDVFDQLNINTPITTKVNYLKFLDLTGKIAFKLSEAKNSPLQLFENLSDVVEALPVQHKNEVMQALNSFSDHAETSQWLTAFEDKHHDLDAVISEVLNT
ncbi:hypothetical protein [Psychroserpens sp. SPM9]|uniref:hypothetical protein n=1 Tax=Psychroserpens sp. SPM9 TaxID=2975598 RepID=UPI0021A717D7|nr:hypothetical protein [Psychroserpens sp. SPM9]MDG5491807.1 hypothetical protein [Psychroserpens sp. SPM9]